MKIFCALGVNVVVLLVLLMQGCKREQPQSIEPTPMFSDTNPPPMDLSSDTNLPSVSSVDTNPPPPIVPIVEPTQPSPAAATDYTILKGDTFSSIAPKFGITVKALQAANPTVDPSKLQIGKKIVIPAPVPAAAVPPTGGVGAVAPMVDGGGLYKVKSGDTLSKIATEHQTTVKAIQSANNLTDSRIKVGQQLKLPVKAAPVAPAPQ